MFFFVVDIIFYIICLSIKELFIFEVMVWGFLFKLVLYYDVSL